MLNCSQTAQFKARLYSLQTEMFALREMCRVANDLTRSQDVQYLADVLNRIIDTETIERGNGTSHVHRVNSKYETIFGEVWCAMKESENEL